MPAGYSGTPLPKKLGIKEGYRVGLSQPPEYLETLLGELPAGAKLVALSGNDLEVVLLFARTRAELSKRLERAHEAIAENGALWLCWPKKTSPLAHDLTGDIVREAGLGAGLVDIKVCAVDEDWSGLKFVVRVSDRSQPARKK
jgi:hypothetical protein